MAELAEADAFDGLGLPLAIGEARLAALPPVRRLLVAPFAAGFPAGLPPPGRLATVPGGRVLWAGLGQWFFEGAAKAPASGAAVVDQTDGWASLALTGEDAAAVLARLVPLDLDPAVFPPGTVARTLLRHVMLLLIGTGDGFELMVPRSYARTVVRELSEAMHSVVARRRIGG